MKKNIQITYSLDTVQEAVHILKSCLQDVHIMTFRGVLGAGKTTLVKQILKSMGVKDMVTSPTFTYLNIYTNESGITFYHFDLYRLNSLDDFCQAGFDEYLYQPNSKVLIEWPDCIMPLLTHSACMVDIEYALDNDIARTATITCKNNGSYLMGPKK